MDREDAGGCAVIATLVVAICVFAVYCIKWLWNGTVVPVCGFHEITWFQALALAVLGHLLCGGVSYKKD